MLLATIEEAASKCGPNNKELKTGTIKISGEYANKLLQIQRVTIGCKMRLFAVSKRCYKYLALGHAQWESKGRDRRNLCFKCGETGHNLKECQNKLSCCICGEKGRSQIARMTCSYRNLKIRNSMIKFSKQICETADALSD